jgi:cerevisin
VFAGVKHTYTISGNPIGYSGHFDAGLIEEIRKSPEVNFIENDFEHQFLQSEEPITQKGAPWNLARISHRDAYVIPQFYIYSDECGEGVDAYVIDTGIYLEHLDFEDRAFSSANFQPDDGDGDIHGHGTHCAGVVAGKIFGVAKRARMFSVKAVRSDGTAATSTIRKGIEFAVECHLKNVTTANSSQGKSSFKGSVMSIILGVTPRSPALELFVAKAVDAGVHVAAGNENEDACNMSPAASDKAVTVGASTPADGRAAFSNFGNCTDIFAPGVNIAGPGLGFKFNVVFGGGTSASTPHVAGLMAYFLSLQPASTSNFSVPAITPKEMKEYPISIASKDKLKNIPEGTRKVSG